MESTGLFLARMTLQTLYKLLVLVFLCAGIVARILSREKDFELCRFLLFSLT